MAATERPPTPTSRYPEDWEVARDPDWITDRAIVRDVATRQRCRWQGDGYRTHSCGEPIVAVLARGMAKRPYGYCAAHLYGRWIEDGFVVGWRLRRGVRGGR